MPCYTVQTTSVEFKAKHEGLLRKALEALKLNATIRNGIVMVDGITIDLNAQRATVNTYDRRQQETLNAIKREYSRQGVLLYAQRNGYVFQSAPQNKYAGIARKVR